MTEARSGHKHIKQLISWHSKEFLPACTRKGGAPPEGTMYVVFAFGTVVKVNPNDLAALDKQWVFEVDKKDYPFHRFNIRSEASKCLRDIAKDYKDVLARCKPEHQAAIKCAYKRLHGGYPLPGGCGADTLVLPLASKGDGAKTKEDDKRDLAELVSEEEGGKESDEEIALWGVIFPENGGLDLISLVLEPKGACPGQVNVEGKEQRRLDFMLTRVVAVIDRDCKVTHLE